MNRRGFLTLLGLSPVAAATASSLPSIAAPSPELMTLNEARVAAMLPPFDPGGGFLVPKEFADSLFQLFVHGDGEIAAREIEVPIGRAEQRLIEHQTGAAANTPRQLSNKISGPTSPV